MRSSDHVRLTGVRCVVRNWKPADAASLALHANNLNVARHLRDRFPNPYTKRDAQRFLKFMIGVEEPSNFAIEVEGAAVGAIGYVRDGDVERFSAEIGYWLGEAFWGRGIVSEALGLTTTHAFESVKLLRLYALPFADNLGSIRVLEKAGYTREALLRASSVRYGQPRDQLLYARINPSWSMPRELKAR